LNLIYAEFLGEYYDDPLFYVVCQMQVSNKGVWFSRGAWPEGWDMITCKVCSGHVVRKTCIPPPLKFLRIIVVDY